MHFVSNLVYDLKLLYRTSKITIANFKAAFQVNSKILHMIVTAELFIW